MYFFLQFPQAVYEDLGTDEGIGPRLPLLHHSLISPDSVLATHLLRIDTGHRQAAMPQQALYVE